MKRNCMKTAMLLGMCLFISGGCADGGDRKESQEKVSAESGNLAESEELAEGYKEIYEEAKKDDTLHTKEVISQIIETLGEEGCCAVDSENRINMTNADTAEKFCETAQNGEEGACSFFQVTDEGGFIRYDLLSQDGKMEVKRSNLSWTAEGEPAAEQVDAYTAEAWNYTEKGYLFLELARPAGFDGPSGHTAMRIAPLEEELRQWNERCILPVGYGGNNLFLTDWDRGSLQKLCLYDLYEPFYEMKYGEEKVFDAKVGTKEYEIPSEEFESVLETFLPVDKSLLQMEKGYDPAEDCYLYRQRGQYDIGGNPDTPYPEVVACEKEEDGTILLTVEAVWKKGNTDRAFTHMVRIGPKEDGTFSYLSNQIVPSEDNQIPSYIPRLTDEEWEEYYSYLQPNLFVNRLI